MKGRPPVILEPLLWPLAQLFHAATSARCLGYDCGFFAQETVGAPVVSIGNITVGGTGKTPLTSLLIQKFGAQGRKVGVVSRGYGGTERGPARVPSDASAESALRFGDEPAWLAARHPEVTVVVGADRVTAARKLCDEASPDLILADDAFQHRRLARGFDIVVIDASEPQWHYRTLPLGRLREDFSGIRRAQAIFITKTNLVSNETLERVRAMIYHTARVPVFEFESHIAGLAPLAARPESSASRLPAETSGRSVLLASGIGRPHTFKSLVERDLGMIVRDHIVFADHHRYLPSDLEKIVAGARNCGAEDIVVTEKDAAKLTGCLAGRASEMIWATRLETTAKTDLKGFYEAVDRALF